MHVNYKQSVIVIIYQMTKTSGVLWDNAYSSVRYHSLTKSSSLPLEHKTPTNLLHLAQSWANQQSSSQFFQARFMSSSTVFLQVPSGLAASFSRLCPIQSDLHVEGYFCPCGEHDQAASTHLLCFTFVCPMLCVRVCVHACVRACVRACVCACVMNVEVP